MRQNGSDSAARREQPHLFEPFNARQWAEAHQREDDIRHGELDRSVSNIWKVIGAAAAVIIALLGWSLQANYANTAKQLDAIDQIQTQLRHLPKAGT